MTSRPMAIVTGGAVRVGRATCLAFARAGCDVLFTYRSSSEEAVDLVGRISEHGVEGFAERLDLADLDVVGALADTLRSRCQRIDVLVHNASVYRPTTLAELTPDDALRHYRINALAPLLLTRGLADPLSASDLPGGGAVIAMCDIHAMGTPRAGFSAYSMSKAALTEMVRTLAVELAPNVRVNGVAPGVVAWPDEGHESDRASQQRYLERVPLGRAGTPEDAAEAVRWLAMDATYVTGHILRIDGGRSRR